MAFVAAACGASREAATSSHRPAAAPVALAQVPPGPHERVPSALKDPTAPGLPKPLVDTTEILGGGPPPDGIPAIDHPQFQRANQVGWLGDQEPVLALTIGGDSRAYPVQVLIWHEIVNDTVGGVPVAVTYCPLCNTAIAYRRQLGGRVLTFGTSGELYNSDLVMYDRQTQSLWVQFLGEAVAGVLTGTKLADYPVQTISWKDWRAAHPDSWVLSKTTGFDRPYGTNPYTEYDRPGGSPFLFYGRLDTRFPPMTRIVGIHIGTDALAAPLSVLQRRLVLNAKVGGQRLVVFWRGGTSSPLDAASIAGGRDIGSTGVFSASVAGRAFSFQAVAGGFRDDQTGSTWNLLGRAVAGPLNGSALCPIVHVDTFWFVWAVFLPRTRLVTS
jgi:hypothetical protein